MGHGIMGLTWSGESPRKLPENSKSLFKNPILTSPILTFTNTKAPFT